VMPTQSQLEESDLDLVVSGTKTAVTMIEGFAREMREEEMAEAISFAHEQVGKVIDLIEQLRRSFGLPAKEPPAPAQSNPLIAEFQERFSSEFRIRKLTSGKSDRAEKIQEMQARIEAEFLPENGEAKHTPEQVSAA